MGKDKIIIFYDNRRNFYVKKSSGEKDLLPESFIDFKRSHKKILAAAYPRMEEHIMSSEIADDEIDKMLREYNTEAKQAEVVRWYKVSGEKLKAIDAEPREIYQTAQYEGEEIVEDIILFVDSIKQELFHESYLVFMCPKCQEKQLQPINKNHVKCCNGCGVYDIDDTTVEVIQKFDSSDSEQNKANAISCLYQWKKEPSSESTTDVKSSFPFYYDGNVYRVSFTDGKSLHQELYKAFAVREVFMTTDRGIVFTPNYKNYLKSLKDYNINSSLYREVKSIENRINSQEYDLLPIDKAFYWYINKYCLSGERKLFWQISGQCVCFENKCQFVNSLLLADDTERAQLINLYRCVSSLDLDNSFFDGYGDSDINLSYMIYKETGLFVYITNGRLVNFGHTFIENLHEFDSSIPDRNIFIESIKEFEPFWNDIKGSFDDYTDFYFDSFDGTYYDRLCFYQYAIQGKKELKYKDVVLSDSIQGFKQIKNIICDAYMSRADEEMTLYTHLVELLKNTMLWNDNNRFVKIREAKTAQVTNNAGEAILTFDSLRELITNEPGKEPSVRLYLKCADTSSKSIAKIRFWYKNRLTTLAEHIKELVGSGNSKTITSEVNRFYNNPDVICVISSILDNTKTGGVLKFKEEQEKAFVALVREAEKLNKDLEEQRKKVSAEEARGTRRSSERTSHDTRPNNSSSKKKTIKVEKRENDDDEWS